MVRASQNEIFLTQPTQPVDLSGLQGSVNRFYIFTVELFLKSIINTNNIIFRCFCFCFFLKERFFFFFSIINFHNSNNL